MLWGKLVNQVDFGKWFSGYQKLVPKFEIVYYVQTIGSWYLCQICQRVDADVFLYYYYHTDNRIVTSTQKWIKRVDVNQKMLVRCPTA